MEDRVRVETLVLGELGTNCYLVWSAAARQAMVIDPGGAIQPILAALARERLRLVIIVNTHGHIDHIVGNAALVKATGAALAISPEDAHMLVEAAANLSLWLGKPQASPAATRLLRAGERLEIGQARFEVRATPGHTPGGISLIGEGLAFTGDTLFAGGIGRTDFPGGDERALLAAIKRELWPLPAETIVYPGHGPETTIGEERSTNPFLAG